MLALLAIVPGLAGLLLLIESLAEKNDSKRYPAPGRFVDHQLHVVESGKGEPTVFLESGLTASSLSWVLTRPFVGEFARVVAYDRAGLAWSSPRKQAPTLSSLLEDLGVVSRGAEPVILVGHSFGGLIVSAFAHANPRRVVGVVLIDPVSLNTYANPDKQNLKRLSLGVRLAKRGGLLARFGVVRGALALVGRGSNKLPMWIGRVSAGRGSSVMNRLAGEIAKLPPETHAPIRAHWSRPGSFRILAQYLELLPQAAREALMMPIPVHIPVIVLSAASATAAELRERDEWTSHHAASRHRQIPNTTHWLQLDRPDLVGEAVRELRNRMVGE